ncbi:Integrase family protein [Desulfonema limicola]|uniref:Integrase family protein n=1 Tax=Desulfonema limicola TaxID=45656 RepID=A0A975B495_9BACT|nr:tyrosine-type recombinase/integrase [Desulfonema limicola]QTA78498.1 Integrase family protein [Desulfonema limicola]
MKLSTCIRTFFSHYLFEVKNSSLLTVKSYKETFKIFFSFAAQYLGVKIGRIELEDLSTDLILSFLEYLEDERENSIRTRNQRLAVLKSFAKMIRLKYPEHRDIADRILNIPQKRAVKSLAGFLSHDEIIQVFDSVNLSKKDGFRDHAILRLMYDSGARAGEVGNLELDSMDSRESLLYILGKGGAYRRVQIWPRTVQIIEHYVKNHRLTPSALFSKYLFINQRREKLTRQGIYKICKKYISLVLPENRLKQLEPAHCFRHSCAVHMLMDGKPLSHIKNHLGHENINSTMIYLKLDLSRKKEVHKGFIEYTRKALVNSPDIDGLIDWDNKDEVLKWMDNL